MTISVLLVVVGCGTNIAPELLPINPQTAHVGSRFELKLRAVDADGDRLDFGFTSPTLSLDNRARIFDLGTEALFSWTPLANDVGTHQIDFTVSDGDTEDRESVQFTIKAATNPETAPVFRKPLGEGTTLDMAVSDCLRVDVMVEDPDSVKVDISQQPVLTGSKLEATGPLESRFSWCPTPEQVTQAVFILRLVADDHDNPVVRKNFTILLRSELKKDCPGDPPVIVHTPPDPRETADAVKIVATVTDDKGLKSDPILYHTTTKPSDPSNLDVATLSQITMAPVSNQNDTYEATLPNPTASLNPGDTATVFYVLVAEDDDDPSGDCDHRTQLPVNDVFLVKVTKPQSSATCTTTGECKSGEMCENKTCVTDSCTPKDDNGDKLYHEQSTCPAKHFCPVAGETTTSTSHCVESCTKDGDCKIAGYRCKVFDTEEGCGKEGTKVVGEACSDFTECAGKAMCLPFKAGYCSISNCDSYGGFSGKCPSGSACIPTTDTRFSLNKHWICLQLCTDNSNCRTQDGYSCKTITDDQGTSRKVCME